MRNLLVLLFIILISSCGNSKSISNNSKNKYIITLVNENTLTEDFKRRNNYFYNETSQIKIVLDSVSKYVYYGYDKPYTYYMIHTKNYKNKPQVSRAAGYKVYHGKKVDLFHGIFHNGLTPKRTIKYFNPNYDTYIKRKDEFYSFSIRCMDAYGCVDIKKRLYAFFEDCPELINKLKNNEIDELDTIKIVEFYENECGNIN